MLWNKIKTYLRPRLIDFSQRIKFIKNDTLVQKLKKEGLLSIGKHTYGKIIVDSIPGSETTLSIGKYCSISRNVRFITGGIHPVDWVALFPFRIKWKMEGVLEDGMPTSNGPITVNNDVWIGTGATILSGVTIGNGAIIMAGAIVTKDVAPYSIVGGIPAKAVKKRFSEDIINKLQQIKWWDWEEEKLKDNIDLLSSNNIEEFVNSHFPIKKLENSLNIK
jgi:acetyltransferase-like isoleucine patch superfamily enzyme